MFRLSRAQPQPIGLDIGHDSIKMLQVEVVGQSLAVVAAARAVFPAEVRSDPALRLASAGEMVRKMLHQQPFHGRDVVTALPREIIHCKNLRLPQMPASEIASAVEFEAPNIFPFAVDKARVHHLPAGEVRQGADVRQEVIVMAARDEDVSNHVELLHRAGLAVRSLDVEPCALFRCVDRFIRRREDEQQVCVMVDVGFRRSQVVIGRGREINFMKPIEIGGRHLQEAVARKLGISEEEAQTLRQRLLDTDPGDDAADNAARRDPVRQAVHDATRSILEELGREISLCLRYFSVAFRGQRPHRLKLVGGEACNPQLQAILNGVLPIPAETGQPLISVDTSRMRPADRVGPLSEWALAFGLALKCTTGPFAPRDGTPRDPNASVEITPSGAQVLDPDQLVRSVAAQSSPAPAASPSSPAAAAAPVAAAPAAESPAPRTPSPRIAEATHA